MMALAWKSLWHRRGTAFLVVLCISLSVALLLGVERVRTQARESFGTTVSGTDLIIGARGNPLQILLSSVFHLGWPTNNVSWKTYQAIQSNPEVAWTVPIQVGDTHRGFRVVGTDTGFFEHYRYGARRPLEFASGKPFAATFDAVVGADVAVRLNYREGSKIVVAHGGGEVTFIEHADTPFTVVGILKRTGTPVDRAVLVSMEGYEGMHEHFPGEQSASGDDKPADPLAMAQADHHDHDHDHGHDHGAAAPENRMLSSFLVGLNQRQAALGMQRFVNEFKGEPLTAVMPGVALQELWEVTRTAENALFLVSLAVVVVGLIGMLTTLLAGLNERRREMAVLRSVGAGAADIFMLVVGEAILLSLGGALLGLAFLYGVQAAVQPMFTAQYGIDLVLAAPSLAEWVRLSAVVLAGTLIGIIPAWRSIRSSLSDGLTVRL